MPGGSRTIRAQERAGHPQALLAEGRVAPGVPMLLGSNKDEGSLFRQQGGGDYIGSEFMFHHWPNDSLVRIAINQLFLIN